MPHHAVSHRKRSLVSIKRVVRRRETDSTSLALSTRKAPTLPATDLYNALPTFLSTPGTQSTDARLAALFRVVQVTQVMGGRADSVESLEAFDEDVTAVDQ